MKKLLKVWIFLTALSAPALVFIWQDSQRTSAPAWSHSPEEIYLRLLEGEILSGNLSRAEFIDRLREKALLTNKAPLPASSFATLYQLADETERAQLEPLLPYYEELEGAEQLNSLQKSF